MSDAHRIRIQCPHCRGTSKAPLDCIGKVGRCSKCKRKFRITEENVTAKFQGMRVPQDQRRIDADAIQGDGDARALKAQATEKMDESAERRLARKGTKVLLVDDEPDLHTVLKALLDSKGLVTLSAYNGKQGLKMAGKERPACIVMDGEMPKMNGFEACSRLKSDTKLAHIPIIMLTGLPKKSGRSESYWREKSRADHFVAKPFDYHDLTDLIIRTILDSGTDDGTQRYTIE